MAELTDEEIAELRKIFESRDLNGDGFIDRGEFHSLLRELDGEANAGGAGTDDADLRAIVR